MAAVLAAGASSSGIRGPSSSVVWATTTRGRIVLGPLWVLSQRRPLALCHDRLVFDQTPTCNARARRL